MKMVWVLVKGKNPVRFWVGPDIWSADENLARTFPTAAAARERAYNMQAEYQETIVPEGVYRMANKGLTGGSTAAGETYREATG